MEGSKGFTLIELLVVVVVVAILASIALPTYGRYVQRGNISEAISGLADLRVKMEQYYQDNRTYLNGADCGVTMPGSAKYFTFSCAATANTFDITATGSGRMVNFAYTIDEQNAKTSTITASGWTGNGSCWAIRPDGSC